MYAPVDYIHDIVIINMIFCVVSILVGCIIIIIINTVNGFNHD